MFKFHSLSFLIDNHSQLHNYQFTKNFCDCNGFGEDWTYSKIVHLVYRLLGYRSIWTPVATFGVSWLKIKPIVLIFPVIESASADSITLTTVRSLWGGIHLHFFELDCVSFFTLLLTFILKCLDASSHLWCLLALQLL